ncbi:hypothetical protein [Candidatus Amarolinea aalborgensis]|uniref:hypothetical protein n=1 Tax=Candidatus Amarolinea aalborgensis TaxID=2249329 RepID=UPI003BF9BF5C
MQRGRVSAVFSFTTLSARPASQAPPIVIYKSNFDGPQAADGWTATTVIGPNQWVLATNYWHSPPQHWHASDPAAVSEAHLGFAGHQPYQR